MGDLLWLLIVLAILFLFVGVLAILVKKLERAKAASPGPGAAPLAEGEAAEVELAAPYKLKDGVLSPGERAFLPVLREAVRLVAANRQLPPPTVLASIRFAEILAVGIPQSENRSLWQKAQNSITNKQADFVICHPETTRPLLVVELDDQTHSRSDRKNRDAFIDQACASAGLPILHIRAASSYNTQALANDIAGKLAARA